jgi:hypothetical protein
VVRCGRGEPLIERHGSFGRGYAPDRARLVSAVRCRTERSKAHLASWRPRSRATLATGLPRLSLPPCVGQVACQPCAPPVVCEYFDLHGIP